MFASVRFSSLNRWLIVWLVSHEFLKVLVKHSRAVALQAEIRRWKKDLFDSIVKYVTRTLLGEIGVKGLE